MEITLNNRAKIVIKIKKAEIHLPSETKEEQKVDVEKILKEKFSRILDAVNKKDLSL